jgi:cephalosporin hydroxylase
VIVPKISRSLRVLADVVESEGARRLFRSRSLAPVSQELAFIKAFSYGHVKPAPNQIDSEILLLLEQVRELVPRTVLEIGRAGGGSLYLLTRVCPPDSLIISLDLGATPRAQDRVFHSFARERQDLKILRGDSHDRVVVNHIRALSRAQIDFLFIDGDHAYEGIKADFEAFSPLVRAGGLIALHDIVPGIEALVGGVPKFWSELKANRSENVDEIVESWEQGGFGIGLVRAD